MNVVRIQQDVIKDALNDKGLNWCLQITPSEAVIFNKYQVYLLDPKDFVLDYDKLIALKLRETTVVNMVLNDADKAKPAFKTGVTRALSFQGKVVNCLELKREDNEELVYLDQTLLKYYDKSAEFEAIDRKSPVYVYENDILVGVVLPVNHEE